MCVYFADVYSGSFYAVWSVVVPVFCYDYLLADDVDAYVEFYRARYYRFFSATWVERVSIFLFFYAVYRS